MRFEWRGKAGGRRVDIGINMTPARYEDVDRYEAGISTAK
jgi:hypothetical protein